MGPRPHPRVFHLPVADICRGFYTDAYFTRTRIIPGVCAELARNVRNALNENGFRWVNIVVSGGFTADKVQNP